MCNPSSTECDVAEESVVDRLFRKQDFRICTGGQRNHEFHTGFLNSINNRIAFGDSYRECLLGEDVFPGFSSGDHDTRMVRCDGIHGDCIYIVPTQDFIEIGVERDFVLLSGTSTAPTMVKVFFVPDSDEFGFRVFVNFSGVATSVDMRHTNFCDSNHKILLVI